MHRVVFLQHGLLDSPAAWVSSGRLASLAFRSYQAGYDVFLGPFCDVLHFYVCVLLVSFRVWALGTYRGTSDHPISSQSRSQQSAFRRVHTHLSQNDAEYWCEVCHEMRWIRFI
jgi:hypothetical protein